MSAGAARAADGPVFGGPWLAPLHADHPLVGRIWSPPRRAFVSLGDMMAALRRADFVLLGEMHENPDHHRLQAWALRGLAAAGRRPALGFEMISADEAPALESYLGKHPRDADGLGPAVAWTKRGWPDWTMYRPIAAAALEAGLPIFAASPPRRLLKAVGRGGLAALATTERRRLGLDFELDPSLRAAIQQDMFDDHCGMLPEKAARAMVDVQLLKDGYLARAMVDAARRGPPTDGAVLITGNGHARRDRGVPMILARLAPARRVAVVAWIEVSADARSPADYAAGYGTPALPFDYVWFTARTSDEDPCERFRRSLEKRRKPNPDGVVPKGSAG